MFKYNNYWPVNTEIFYANLTWFHIASMIISWLAFVLGSWRWFPLRKKQKIPIKESTVVRESMEDSLHTQYKLAKQKLAEKDLTPEQRSKEKKAEAQQLAAILKLLQEKKDMFQVDSMDQLEDQLRLYRK